MKNHSAALFCFLMFLLPISLLAQDLPKIIPPSPEAASLGKFTEVPISHYTGLPNVSIPIASYEVGGKSFPVGISYHARGVQVAEVASRVGIGWALNAGGQISRQIRNQPDDGPGGYINRSNTLMDALGETGNQSFFGTQPVNLAIRESYLSQEKHSQYKPDRHPDLFNIQAGGLSAKFIFSYEDDKPLLQSYDDVVITYDMGSNSVPSATNVLKSFVVTDKDGFKYYFGISKDQLRSAQNWNQNFGNYEFFLQGGYNLTSSDFNLSYTSWLLMDVESPNGELVSFGYEEQVSEYYQRSYDKKSGGGSGSNISSYVSKTQSHQYQLKEIIYSGGKIIIEGTTLRQDLRSPTSSKESYELDKVKVYDNNNDLVKSFQLYHSYPNTVNDNNKNSELAAFEPEAAKRLRLDSITEVGKNNVAKPPYAFTYFDQPMPHRFSNSQDLWGYYNGADNLEFLLFYEGAYGPNDRTIDEDKSLAGMLERITYPTGGSTKFIYEHNKGVLGNEYNDIEFPAVNPIEDRAEGLTHLGNQYYVNNDYYSKDIIMADDILGSVAFDIDLPTINGIDHNLACGNSVQNCGFDIRLEPINDNTNPTRYLYAGYNEIVMTGEGGDYKLILDPKPWMNWDPSPGNVNPFDILISWKEQPVSQDDILYASGKRIKKIEFFDSGNNLVSNKEYAYINGAGNETGIILGMASFITLNPYFIGTNFNVFRVDAAISGSPFTTYQGNTIGYEMVTEFYGDVNNNHGKTEYKFTVPKDSGEYLKFPITPPTDNEWLRGLPQTIKYYKRDSNNFYKMVKKTENEYLYANNATILPLVFQPLTDYCDLDFGFTNANLLYDKTDTFYRLPLIHVYHPYDNNGSLDTSDFWYKIYHYTGGTLNNFRTTETLYDETVTPTLVTESETEFNYAKHYQPAKVTSVSSDGIPIIQTFFYPQDLLSTSYINSNYSSPVTIEDDLDYQNRVVPLEVKTYKDANNDGIASTSEQTNFTKTIYNWDPTYSNILEPIKIQTAKGDNTLKDRIEFKDYDADGNILQVSKADGMDITYIYGYNNSLPVAKIENASYSQVSSQVANIQSKSNLDDDHCQDSSSCDEKNLRTALNTLRSSLSKAMVTTYTYDPLIGITSMTDPKGYTVYYEYDDLNRLVRVKDEDGKIMSENKYHYLLDN